VFGKKQLKKAPTCWELLEAYSKAMPLFSLFSANHQNGNRNAKNALFVSKIRV
jgi:hypothetical protein